MKKTFFQTQKQIDLLKVWKSHKKKGSRARSPWTARKRKGSTVQSLLMKRGEKGFNSAREAKKWAKDHGYKTPKIDVKPNYYRLRQLDPGKFVKGSFITKKFNDRVQAVIGIPK